MSKYNTELVTFSFQQTEPVGDSGSFACYCVGKQVGEPACPCMMKFNEASALAKTFNINWDKLKTWQDK